MKVLSNLDETHKVKSRIINLVHETIDKANKMFPTLDMEYPSITFKVTGKVAGYARYAPHEVDFNIPLALENGSAFDGTVIHEVAHLVTHRVYPWAKQAHGPEFKSIDRKLGGRGTTYHSYDVSNVKKIRKYKRIPARCDCGIHYITKAKYRKIKSGDYYYKCRSCNDFLEPMDHLVTRKSGEPSYVKSTKR